MNLYVCSHYLIDSQSIVFAVMTDPVKAREACEKAGRAEKMTVKWRRPVITENGNFLHYGLDMSACGKFIIEEFEVNTPTLNTL